MKIGKILKAIGYIIIAIAGALTEHIADIF